jgi:uncharacterized membrane protein
MSYILPRTRLVFAPATRVAYSPCGNQEPSMNQILKDIRAFDQSRKGFPGEHFIVGTAGSLLLNSARRRSGLARMLMLLAGGALLVRAASGRDGLARVFRAGRAVSEPSASA